MKKTILVPVIIDVCSPDNGLCGINCNGYGSGGNCDYFTTQKGNPRILRWCGNYLRRCQQCLNATSAADSIW